MRVRFGMIGTGPWAQQVHLPVLGDCAEVELAGVWGRNFGKAQALAQQFGGRGFADLDEMLSAVDAVSFAVPPHMQPDLVIAAARSGKHLLLEKPIALQPAEAQRLVDAVEAAGVAAVVFFTRRFIPEIVAALPGLLAQRPWKTGRVRFHSGAMLPGSPFAVSEWRQTKGALWDIGPHAVSVLLPVLGPVVEARATQDGHATILLLRHASGATSTTSLNLHAAPADRGEFYEFAADDRTVRIDVEPAPRQPCFAAALANLLQAIAKPGAEPCPCGVRLGGDVVTILSRAEQSDQGGSRQ